MKLNDNLGVVVVRHDGKIDFTELRKVLDEQVTLPDFRPGLQVVGDFGGSETPLTGDEIRELAEYARRTHHAFGATKWAIIAPNTLTYGLARMYSALTQEYEVAVEVLRTVDAG